ncbi:MAG: hypothetical protein IPG43_16590 [Proteobacteria bacterium]|nr:hypothetical protein [Pseudomonadota bacterium]
MPGQAAAREARLADLAGDLRTLVFLRAPHRILASLLAMADAFGATSEAVVAAN